MVATTERCRREVGERAGAIWLGLSRYVEIDHALLASTKPVAAAVERSSPTVRSSVERELVRFIAIVCDTRPERKAVREQCVAPAECSPRASSRAARGVRDVSRRQAPPLKYRRDLKGSATEPTTYAPRRMRNMR